MDVIRRSCSVTDGLRILAWPHKFFCEQYYPQRQRYTLSISEERHLPLILTILESTPSNHDGLSVITNRMAIRRLARARGLTATLTNHPARISRRDIGSFASIQALSPRNKVRYRGSPNGSLVEVNLCMHSW